jgi:hypothetical protein
MNEYVDERQPIYGVLNEMTDIGMNVAMTLSLKRSESCQRQKKCVSQLVDMNRPFLVRPFSSRAGHLLT